MKINPGVDGIRRDWGSGPEYWYGKEIPEEVQILKGRQEACLDLQLQVPDDAF